MARLIIVSGASGAGKTFLLEQLNRLNREIIPIKKYTTRSARATEPLDTSFDLIFSCSDEEVHNCDYNYIYCEHNYGINKKDIDSVLTSGNSPIVIVARFSTIANIKNDYKNALVLYVQNVLSSTDLQKELVQRGDLIGVEERIRRQRNSLNDYIQNIEKKLINYVIINDFTDTFMLQVQNIFAYEKIRGTDENYIFAIIPLKQNYNDIYSSYINAINTININGKIEIQSAEFNYKESISTENFELNIERAGLIFCDVSEMSPNIFYKLGYVKAKDKELIITAQENTKLPFEIRNNKAIIYKNPIELQEKITKELIIHYHITNQVKSKE